MMPWMETGRKAFSLAAIFFATPLTGQTSQAPARPPSDSYTAIHDRHPYDEATFDQRVRGGVTLVDVSAAWCPTCRAWAPSLEKVAQENDFYFTMVDSGKTEESFAVARAHLKTKGIDFGRSVPYIALLRDGEVVWTSEKLWDSKAAGVPTCPDEMPRLECQELKLRYHFDKALERERDPEQHIDD